jgi:hypothetical protein
MFNATIRAFVSDSFPVQFAFKKISKRGDAYGEIRFRFTSRKSLRPMRQADSRAGLD